MERVLKESDHEGQERLMSIIPNCLDLLTDLLGTYRSEGVEKVGSEERLKINAALGYLIAPKDVIPEEEAKYSEKWKYYRDDVFLILFVINELIDSLGKETIKKYWPNEEEKDEIIEELRDFKKIAENLIEREVKGLTDNIIEYSGLKKK